MKIDAMSAFFHLHLSLDCMEVEEFSNLQRFNLVSILDNILATWIMIYGSLIVLIFLCGLFFICI